MILNLVRELAHRLLSVGAKIGRVIFGEEIEKIDHVTMAEIKVDHPGAATFPPAFGGDANFAHAPASRHEIAFFGRLGQLALKFGVVVVTDQFRDQARECGCFDQSHERSKV
jgi:hypothetical protein